MPYRIEKQGRKWCVVGPERTHGCHDSREKAIRQQRALWVNAPESAEGLVAQAGPPDSSAKAMVAVYPLPEEAEALAVEGDGALMMDDLHLTLVFLGDADELDAEQVTVAVGQAAAELGPLSGAVGGIGEFAEGPDGVPVVALPDVQGLTLLRERVVDELGHRGIRSPSEHGFLPHMTLVYKDRSTDWDAVGELAEEVLGRELTFEAVSVVIGDDRTDYPLAGARVAAALAQSGSSVTMPLVSALAAEPLADAEPVEPIREHWEGVLGIEGSPTGDGRIIVREQVFSRELPVPFSVQIQNAEGHDGSFICGRIELIEHIALSEFDRREEFALGETHEDAIVIWGEGTLDGSDYAAEAKRLLDNGAGVSIDGLHFTGQLFDAESLEEVAVDDLDLEEIFEGILKGTYLQGLAGKIGGVTVVGLPAFEEAEVAVTASGSLHYIAPAALHFPKPRALTAAAGPLKPPAEWFEAPHFTELTPLTITKEGRVFGHLCDWDGCHVGFQGICVPPFRSPSGYAYFNLEPGIECADGQLVPCGKIMFSRDGVGHAPLDESMTVADVQRHYDNATNVGAHVRAGEDAFGTWLVGVLRSDLNDLEIQHLRTHPPSGDWRPVKGQNDLIAAFSVPIPGFPIARRALVASADGLVSGVITAPLEIDAELNYRKRWRKKKMLSERVASALGRRPSSRARMREEMIRARERD